MHLFRPKQESKDLLFLLTEEYCFCVLEFDDAKGEILTRSSGRVTNPSAKRMDHVQVCLIDPQLRLIAMNLFRDTLTVIPMNPDTGELSDYHMLSWPHVT